MYVHVCGCLCVCVCACIHACMHVYVLVGYSSGAVYALGKT